MSESVCPVEREIATIRCMVAQQLDVIERCERQGTDRRVADLLLRELLRRDEDLRRRAVPRAAICVEDVRSA